MREFVTKNNTHDFNTLFNQKQRTHILFSLVWVEEFQRVQTLNPSQDEIDSVMALAGEKNLKRDFIEKYQMYLHWLSQQVEVTETM